jgi:SpoVK/Ycf46/Vps4 family AAA+-type ATPase
MSIQEFLHDLQKKDSKLKDFFAEPDKLIKSLLKLDNVIGMKKVKSQIVKQIKTFISTKAKGIYKESDRKHCLLCGPPGCGKTTVGRILCEIWVSIGFIGRKGSINKKVNSFNRVQDELIRSQRQEIKELKDKIRMCTGHINKINRLPVVNKRAINNLIRIKDSTTQKELINTTIRDLSSSNKIIGQTNDVIKKIIAQKNPFYNGFGVEADASMSSTQEKDEDDVPFHAYNRNDLVSRYVGDTAHRSKKAMDDALDGVAYIDEAYNLCNDSSGFSDSYGREALTTINQYMDEHADKLIVVFAGYKDEIYNNLFRVQKGLESRFTNKFEIEDYTPEELVSIYVQRLGYSEWYIKETPELIKIIKDNFKLFKYQGRDMDTLALFTKNIVSERIYDSVQTGQKFSSTITDLDVVRMAVATFKSGMIGKVEEVNTEDNLRRIFESLSSRSN